MASQVPEIGFLAIDVMLAMRAGSGGIDLSGIALANLAGVASGLFAAQMFSATDAPYLFTNTFVAGAVLVGIEGSFCEWRTDFRVGHHAHSL
jgi:simple sugar transport system permease protein